MTANSLRGADISFQIQSMSFTRRSSMSNSTFGLQMPQTLVQWRRKLFTKEDPQNLHKTFGILVLLSFFYRYGVCYRRSGNLEFNGSIFDWVTILVHLGLSTSSLIFIVLPKRIRHKPLIIWEEYRLHAILFTLKASSGYFFNQLFPHSLKGTNTEQFVLYSVMMCIHLFVDEITRRHGSTDGTTTVRVSKRLGFFPTLGLRAYSTYQILASCSLLSPGARLGDLGYNTYIAIQSSAFLMTLFRKSLISAKVHAAIYGGCLVLSLYVMFQSMNFLPFIMFGMMAACLRFGLRMDKYLLWALYSLCVSPYGTSVHGFNIYK